MSVGGCDGLHEYGEDDESGLGLRGPDADGDVVSFVALLVEERASVCGCTVESEGNEKDGGGEGGEVSHMCIVTQDGGIAEGARPDLSEVGQEPVYRGSPPFV